MAHETDGNDVGNGSDAGIAVRTKPKNEKTGYVPSHNVK